MREAIGGTWLFQIVIAFVLLFTAFICLSINHSKAFNVKNMIINSIERAGNMASDNADKEPIKSIVEYLQDVSYRTTGNCPAGYIGYSRDGVRKSDGSSNSAFCIKTVQSRPNDGTLPGMTYYRIIAFYQLDLPIFSQVFNFKVTGDTRVMNSGMSYERITG